MGVALKKATPHAPSPARPNGTRASPTASSKRAVQSLSESPGPQPTSHATSEIAKICSGRRGFQADTFGAGLLQTHQP